MSFTTKLGLKSAIKDWLVRSDLSSAVLDDIITLAEKDIARNLRAKTVRTSFTLTSDNITTVSGLIASVRSLRYNTSTLKYPLIQMSVEGLAGVRRSGTGRPHYFAIADTNVLLDVDPDMDYTMEITYFAQLSPLLTDSEANTELLASPDIYLFACLKEAELYLEHDERNPVWTAKYQKAIADENDARERAELGAGPKMPRLPMVFG
jgi:hypothetical protein